MAGDRIKSALKANFCVIPLKNIRSTQINKLFTPLFKLYGNISFKKLTESKSRFKYLKTIYIPLNVAKF